MEDNSIYLNILKGSKSISANISTKKKNEKLKIHVQHTITLPFPWAVQIHSFAGVVLHFMILKRKICHK
ncbi:unnamed protein product [Callosobruchus maculatus]|uniref:Uncharacterized protein n=1 Tax=Callosobruchus maculatus TaxID=64391 RepID=A0A653BLD7_CALMS|nr:unnamed protein product [Callosobruchus maculatus]